MTLPDFAEDLGWEENEKELASHLSFTVGTDNEELASLIKIGCVGRFLRTASNGRGEPSNAPE